MAVVWLTCTHLCTFAGHHRVGATRTFNTAKALCSWITQALGSRWAAGIELDTVAVEDFAIRIKMRGTADTDVITAANELIQQSAANTFAAELNKQVTHNFT